MTTFSRVTTLLIMAVLITVHRESEAKEFTVRVPDTNEVLRFESEKAFEKWIHLGLAMFDKVFYAICWFATLTVYPQVIKGHKGMFEHCYYPNVYPVTKRINELKDIKAFNETLKARTNDIREYLADCEKLLITPKAIPIVNESSLLDDGEDDYAFKAYFHCLIHEFRFRHDPDVVETLYKERLHSQKGWMLTTHDKTNELRVRHGAEPLQLNKTLMNAAQKAAKRAAKECFPVESKRDDLIAENIYHTPGCYYQGFDPIDERAFSFQCTIMSYTSGADSYPFPGSVDGWNEYRIDAIAKFVNMVWKGAKSVGYGYAFNPKCGTQGRREDYIVAQFYPVDKKFGEYKKNVSPPVVDWRRYYIGSRWI